MALLAATVPASVEAGGRLVLQPVQLAGESVRFERGDFAIDQASVRAAVQVRPASDDHGQMSFMVTVLNTGPIPFNIDSANMRIEGTAEPVQLVTRREMERKAARRAGWNKFFTALGGSIAAARQASQRNTYNATTLTPYGAYYTSISAPCATCQIAATQTLALTSAKLEQIRGALDSTRDALRQQTFQLTTVEPGHMYGGRIYLSKFDPKPMSSIRLTVTVGEEAFSFAFRFAPEGAPTPQYRMSVAPAIANAVPASAAPAAPVAVRVIPATGTIETVAPTPLRVSYTPALPRTAAAPGTATKWRNYYNALLGSGVSRAEAKAMADGQFGVVD